MSSNAAERRRARTIMTGSGGETDLIYYPRMERAVR
jgi:hypothetical protein